MKNKVLASIILVTAILFLFFGNIHFNIDDAFNLSVENKPYSTSNQKFIDVFEEFDDIEQVQLNLNRGDLKIKSGDKLSIKGSNIREYSYDCTVYDKTLIVEEKTTNILNGNASYILTVPSTLPLIKITVNCSSGAVKFSDISVEEIIFHVEKGSLEGFGLDASKLMVDAGMGSINLHNILSQNINITSGMGSVNIDCQIDGTNGDIKIDSPIGSVNLTLNNNPADFYYNLANRISSVTIDGVKPASYRYYSNNVTESKYGLTIGSGISSVEICFDYK